MTKELIERIFLMGAEACLDSFDSKTGRCDVRLFNKSIKETASYILEIYNATKGSASAVIEEFDKQSELNKQNTGTCSTAGAIITNGYVSDIDVVNINNDKQKDNEERDK